MRQLQVLDVRLMTVSIYWNYMINKFVIVIFYFVILFCCFLYSFSHYSKRWAIAPKLPYACSSISWITTHFFLNKCLESPCQYSFSKPFLIACLLFGFLSFSSFRFRFDRLIFSRLYQILHVGFLCYVVTLLIPYLYA